MASTSASSALAFASRFSAALLAVSLSAQTVQLRIENVEADRAQPPREVLSPAVVRNAFASFHLVVTAPANESYFLAVQANPAGVLQWKLYEEKIPDALEEARPPYFGVIPAGQTTRAYLLDVWVPRDAPVGKVRLEALVKVGYWRIAPMEVRILSTVVPDLPHSPAISLQSVIRRNAAQKEALKRP
jgi:hypothetical protein